MISDSEDKCFNTYCNNTHNLRQAPFLNQQLWFCPQCHECYLKRQCCYFCAQIYNDDDQNFLDGMKWIRCDMARCGKWVHTECESKNIEMQLQNKSFKYKCPWCRIEGQSKPRKRILKPELNSDHDPDYTTATIKKVFSEGGKSEESISKAYEPIMTKNTFLEELLRKNGEYCQCINGEDLQSDLGKLRSLAQ